MQIQAKSKFILIGDSITDCGRAQPAGEGNSEALGKGYVNMVDAMLQARYPERRIRVVNKGTSGNTVRNLKERWQADVIDLKPDWLSIMIGINDVWRQFDSHLRVENHVLLPEYERTLTELLEKTRPLVKGLVLLSPYYIEPNAGDAMRAAMDQYGAVVRAAAKRFDAIFVDVQAAFNDHLKHVNANALAWDRVHPAPTGHFIIARALLKSLEYEW